MTKKLNHLTSENTGPTGIAFKNPTHLEEARMASSQSELINMLHDSKYTMPFKERVLSVDYNDDNGRVKPVPGVTAIKSLGLEDLEELEGIMNTIIRCRPRTYRIHILLGDYENKTEIKTASARFINQITKPRSTKEIADYLAKIFANKSERVVEMSFSIKEGSFADSTFRAELKTWATTEEEYENPEKEHAYLEIGYFGTR